MFTIPSLWNLLISTLVFFIAAAYLRRYLDAQEIPKGLTRSILVLVLASLASWGAGAVTDWAEEQMEAPPEAQSKVETAP